MDVPRDLSPLVPGDVPDEVVPVAADCVVLIGGVGAVGVAVAHPAAVHAVDAVGARELRRRARRGRGQQRRRGGVARTSAVLHVEKESKLLNMSSLSCNCQGYRD